MTAGSLPHPHEQLHRHLTGARAALERNDARAFIRNLRGLLAYLENPDTVVADPPPDVITRP